MEITPLEIRKFSFRTRLVGGIDPDHVQSFLQQIAGQVEEQTRENATLSIRAKELEIALERYRRIEETLSETLLTAQRATDDARANAQKEAELIFKEAQFEADRYENESRERVRQLDSEYRSIQVQKEAFVSRFRALLSDQVSFLEAMSGHVDERVGESA